MSLECEVLYALWALYKQNLITVEQKGIIKDMLIQQDFTLIQTIQSCQSQNILQNTLLELLHEHDSIQTSCCISPIKREISNNTNPNSRQRILSAVSLVPKEGMLFKTRSSSSIVF